MKKIIRMTFDVLICLLCWLTISPLFYYLAGRWGLKSGRLLLMLGSPLFLIVYLCIFVWGYVTYLDYERKYYFTNENRIERITGVRLPDMDVVEYDQGRTSITGDYTDWLLVEFEEIPSEEVYQTLDSLIASQKTGWRKQGVVYKFSVVWGNHFPAPTGENEDEDRFFDISFEERSRQAVIDCGMW